MSNLVELKPSIRLECGDCLELMKSMPDKSVDMILCDLPYGTTACKWDTIIPFEPLWGLRTPVSVIKISRDNIHKGSSIHPTQKPVALFEYLIKTYTNEGDLVLDNCMGSGTAGVACKNLGREFIGFEKDQTYFEIAKKRIEETP
jgi:DNA modification methylase